ncbi:cation efflux family-domain-containing protein [Russula earlei]|uniref:Cation efflux family-domain-containing protein n=1 Tax=Russula earlei TaxID=71964 RepID=A0ACC0UEL6_9AGAM|nr:cation efflux family-domain-containing protein [Russula earlei]
MARRRIHTDSVDKGKSPVRVVREREHQDYAHSDDHSHIRGIFGGQSHSHSHSHPHSHGHGGELIETLQSAGDRGSRITLVGLGVNVVLTSAKGAAGWLMNSAALLADAGHSLSDLLGDFVVLFSWRLSRRPPSRRYPFGLAKFETVGTGLVAILLLGAALGIGSHSLSLLFSVLSETAPSLPAGPLQTLLLNLTALARNVPGMGHIAHSHAHALDPNAAWFAAVSIVSKEWLFRVTRKVAKQENSPVLLANAYHHRSDAYSSLVALVAILGSGWFPAWPLDPVGGLLVSVVIFRQGLTIFKDAFWDMTDASAQEPVLQSLSRSLDKLTEEPRLKGALLHIRNLRARRAGSQLFVDLTVVVPGELTAFQLGGLEKQIVGALKAERKDVKEVQGTV